jgi:hypothetical protein
MLDDDEEVAVEWSLYRRICHIYHAMQDRYPYLAEDTEDAVGRKATENSLIFLMLL